jgi:hypothetical protein
METLNLFAELAIGLLGFSGVVSVLGKSKLPVAVRKFRVVALLMYSTMTCLASILPIVLISYQFELNLIWLISGSVLMVSLLVVPIVTASKFSRILSTDTALRVIRVPVYMLLVIVWAYLGYGLLFDLENLQAIYLVGVSYLLAMAIFHFCMLVSSIQFEEGD